MKVCIKCSTAKDDSEFPERGGLRRGRQSACLECRKAYGRDYMKKKRAGLIVPKRKRHVGALLFKKCGLCETSKPISQFYKVNKLYEDNLLSAWSQFCKPCNTIACRERRLRNGEGWKKKTYRGRKQYNWKLKLKVAYGITESDYYSMFNAQGRACAICRISPDRPAGLHVDHDHATGRVRGLLCNSCNTAIGLLRDDVGRMKSAIQYIERNS